MEQEKLILDICHFIDENSNEDLKIEDITNEFHFNRYYLMKLFKKYTGTTMIEYLNIKRIHNSMPPLVNTDDKILKIALNAGFNSLEYYSEQFNKVVGISPVNFRKLASIYDVTPYITEGSFETMENERLLTIRNNINDLKKLKEEITNTHTKNAEIAPTLEKAKVLTLMPRKSLNKTA